jgi:hypothetical protein
MEKEVSNLPIAIFYIVYCPEIVVRKLVGGDTESGDVASVTRRDRRTL